MKALVVIAILAAGAHAEPPGMTAAVDVAPTRIDDAARRDAAADRGALLDTALATPSGSVSASLRMVPDGGLVSATAGLAPGVEIAADAGRTFRNRDTTYAATIKIAVMRRAMWQLALVGSYRRVSIDCGDCMDDRDYVTGGAVATGCIDRDCHTLVTFGGGMILPKYGDDVSPAAMAGVITGSGPIRLLGEAAWMYGQGFGFAGGRLGSPRFAVDAGVAAVADDHRAQVAPMIGVGGRL